MLPEKIKDIDHQISSVFIDEELVEIVPTSSNRIYEVDAAYSPFFFVRETGGNDCCCHSKSSELHEEKYLDYGEEQLEEDSEFFYDMEDEALDYEEDWEGEEEDDEMEGNLEEKELDEGDEFYDDLDEDELEYEEEWGKDEYGFIEEELDEDDNYGYEEEFEDEENEIDFMEDDFDFGEEIEDSFYQNVGAENSNPSFEGYLEEESSEMVWRMRPPVRYQGKKVICWAAAISSWSIVTKGVKKFKTTKMVIDYFKKKGVVTSKGSLISVKGLKEIKRTFGLSVRKFEGGGSMSFINIGHMLKDSHLLVVFRRPGARFFHMIVVFGVDRFNACYMDPAINPKLSLLDKVKKNRICQKIDLFGDGATDFWVLWKRKRAKEFEKAEIYDDSELMDFESDYGAAATAEKVKWYQTILQVAVGYPQVPINGKHNDIVTKEAMKDFQQRNNLKVSGYLKVDSNLALTQVALEWIYRKSISNKLGKRSNTLKSEIKIFQRKNKLKNDGKVGKNTRLKMNVVLKRLQPKRNARWIQIVLRYIAGFKKVKPNGNLNDINTQKAIRKVQKKYNLKITKKIEVDLYLALIQIALEKIIRKRIKNKKGTWSEDIKKSLNKFKNNIMPIIYSYKRKEFQIEKQIANFYYSTPTASFILLNLLDKATRLKKHWNFSAKGEIKNKWLRNVRMSLGLKSSFAVDELLLPTEALNLNKLVTKAYADMYLSDSNIFKWAGMAAFASSEVGFGMSIMRYIAFNDYTSIPTSMAGFFSKNVAISPKEGENLFWLLSIGNRSVFLDIFWQHLAYRQNGIGELEKAFQQKELNPEAFIAWQTIDQGNKKKNQELIWKGNKMLLKYEQQVVLQKSVYDKEKSLFRKISPTISTPFPKGKDFNDYIKGGDLSDFKTRWSWIEQAVVPVWRKTEVEEPGFVNEKMQEFSQES